MKNKKIIILSIGALTILASLIGAKSIYQTQGSTQSSQVKENIIIYKSPNCGCCVGHASYLTGQGYKVEKIETEDIDSIKEKYNIPREYQSCHTTIIGDYFVEGHVPAEAIIKLLEEKPEIDGIALPDMPAGSPGMPGIKAGEFVIYSLTGGESQEFMRI